MSVDGYKSSDHLTTKYLNATAGITTQRLTVNQLNMNDGTLVVDSTNTEAFAVRKNADGEDVLLVDTENSKVNVRGDFDVVGTFTYTGQNIFQQVDNIGIMASENDGDSVDTEMLWKNSGGYTGLYRDYSDGEWHLVEGVASEPTTSVGAGSYANLNVAEPTSSSHCATKNYVDTSVSSIDFSPYFLKSGGSFSGDIKLEGNTLFLRNGTPGYVYSLSYNATNGMEIQSDNLISFVESDSAPSSVVCR